MAVFRCKMCGANLNVTPGMEVCECESCGTNQTLPKLNDDRRMTMYERANHFRRNNEFDKAMGMYEQILNEDKTDAEAYWSIVLCRFGIDYVEDPATHKRVPTINRAQQTSIFTDEDYKEALNNASLSQKVIFEQEAKTIDEIQKGILEISRQEEPFDVFICYKESDAEGARTRDSVIANDIYHQLTREGLKVFFAAITLEDKLGQAYEPYIFAALNSAKVMIVLGTKAEYFNAPWVKNEWSRYLHIIKDDPKKVLIPAYKDMDAYDLPDEFSFLQAQDMSKIGFMNDLIHGIKKVVNADKNDNTEIKSNQQETVVYNRVNAGSDLEQAINRADFFLEEGEWNSASMYYDKALDISPDCALAYVGKLMIDCGVKKRSDLADLSKPFTFNDFYVRAVKYADESLKKEITQYDHIVNERIFNRLKEEYNEANTEKQFQALADKAKDIDYFDGVSNFIQECITKKEDCHKEMIYSSALTIMGSSKTFEDYGKVIIMLEKIPGYKDADELKKQCENERESMETDNGLCIICREREGVRLFVPNDNESKCCDKCMNMLNLLHRSKGKRGMACDSSIQFLNERVAYIVRPSVRERISSIVDAYIQSIPELSAEIQEKIEESNVSKRVKTEYELEEERRQREEETRRQEELRRKEIERKKQAVIAKNAEYEYDVQTVIDKKTGGTDTDMLKYVLQQNSRNGWRLMTVVNDKVSDGAPVGQNILIFERRIKEEG